jgi:hypothetical protein
MTFFLGQLDLWKFFVWTEAIALYNFYLMTFFLGQHFVFGSKSPLKKNPTKIWGANPSLLAPTKFSRSGRKLP